MYEFILIQKSFVLNSLICQLHIMLMNCCSLRPMARMASYQSSQPNIHEVTSILDVSCLCSAALNLSRLVNSLNFQRQSGFVADCHVVECISFSLQSYPYHSKESQRAKEAHSGTLSRVFEQQAEIQTESCKPTWLLPTVHVGCGLV